MSFRALESKDDDEIKPKSPDKDKVKGPNDPEDTGIGEGGVESYSGAGRESAKETDGEFIRWSASTEIGDFIRDAARAKEFEVEIEGSPDTIKVAVPSFNDRTFYLRQKLRRMSSKISDMAILKTECDKAAHKTGQRYAMSGCGAMIGYWYLVYRLTFETDLGWDVMEPGMIPHPHRPKLVLTLSDSNISGRAVHANRRLPMVSLPQQRGQLPLSHEPYHQQASKQAVRAKGLRSAEMGSSNRGSERYSKRDQNRCVRV